MRRATTFAIGVLLCTAVVPAQPTTIIAAKPNETGPATSGQRPQPTPRPRPTPHPRPPTITVTNINDSGPGSLRQALADARDGYTIIFAITGSIGLTSGELLVGKNVAISGPGADMLAVDGNSNSRVLYVAPGKNVTISRLAILNGKASGSFPDDSGAGIYIDHATAVIDDCTMTGNSADGSGGAIYNNGAAGTAALLVSNTRIIGNDPRKSYAYGIPIQGKRGFVRSPYAPSKGELDIRRYPKGTQLKCPFTGKIFIAP